jgi:hypothetical protein
VFAGLLSLLTVFIHPHHSPFIFWHHAALVICLENSFWYHSASVSFIDAFRQAFEIYTEIAMQKVEIALKELGDWSESTAFKSALSETLLNNRLCMLDCIFSYY